MIVSGQTLRRLCTGKYTCRWRPYRRISPLITPFSERQKAFGASYGLSIAGYDVRLAQEVVLKPGDFSLASTLEEFNMPDFLVGIVHDKSTWARRGIAVQNTVIEPGWRGYLTLELTNHGNDPHFLSTGTPIAQILFHFTDVPVEQPYDGKYQDQQAGPQPAILEQ